MNLCVWIDMFHLGSALAYSTIDGMMLSYTLHSGCRYSRHLRPTRAAHCSAHAKSSSDCIMTFNSSARAKASSSGGSCRLGDRHTQSNSPLRGCVPDVSMNISKPRSCKARVSAPSAARDDNSLRRARRGTFDDGAYVGRRIEPGIPRILGIAPAAPDVATAQTDEVGRLARMAPLALNSIEILDQRQPQTALQHIVRNATVHL